ncbi:MAG: hypothetical protein IPO31_15380 [Candidatus Obscuribacter sp.]|nr:hypothetical protein [Candidatus Obscuribacter sp.]
MQEKGERSPLRKLILLNVLTHIWSGVCPPTQALDLIPVDGEITRQTIALVYPSAITLRQWLKTSGPATDRSAWSHAV